MRRPLLLVVLLGACSRQDSPARPDPATKPTSAKASAPTVTPPAPAGCATDLDCRLTSLGEDCCDHCGEVALSLTELRAREARCSTLHKKCPSLDCPFEPGVARCELGRCVRVKRP